MATSTIYDPAAALTQYQSSQAVSSLLGQTVTQPSNGALDPNLLTSVAAGTSTIPTNPAAQNAIINTAQQALDYQGQATQDEYQAAGYDLQQTGYSKEEEAYNNAREISLRNANLSLLSGKIADQQEQRKIYQTISGQRADITGSGFTGNSGSALYLMADSAQQGALARAQIRTNAQLQAQGYQAGAAADQAQIEAAGVASGQAGIAANAARDAAAQARAAGVATQTNAVNALSALQQQQLADASGTLPGQVAGTGAGGSSIPGVTRQADGSTLYAGISAADAANNAAMLGYRVGEDGKLVPGTPTQNVIQVSQQGKDAAAAYVKAVNSGQATANPGAGAVNLVLKG